MRGYKVFNSDFRCQGFLFELGKTYKHEGKIELCKSGFHFCKKAVDCFRYYGFDPDNIVCEIDAIGNVIESGEDSKCVTSEISIVRRLSWGEVIEIVNSGYGNSGLANSGNANSGHRNSGDRNSGYGNSGLANSGHTNSGCYNSGNYNSGFFNTNEPRVRAFNRDTEFTREEFERLMPRVELALNTWVGVDKMTNEEKAKNPSCETTGGFLRIVSYKDAWRDWWKGASTDDRLKIKNLPNFDATIFEEITGIDINPERR